MMQEALFAIRPEACARFRHAASSCTRCADVCPAGAVSFAVQAHIHARDCRQCGACAAVCPLEAITGGVDLQERKARSLAEVRDVRLQCQRAEGDFGDVDGTVSVHCLQSVSDTQIARALLAGVRRWVFVRNDCSRCERRNPKAGIDAVLRRIHAFAEELGVTVEVEIVQKASTVDFTRRAFWEKRLEEGYGTE
ncbi:MAG: 4Fe-4S binding protein, partial [Duodenibacillus sp.]